MEGLGKYGISIGDEKSQPTRRTKIIGAKLKHVLRERE